MENNIIVNEDGYFIALYDEQSRKEDVDKFGNNDTKYINALERVLKHLIGIIQAKKLYDHFSPEIINDALLIKTIINGKTRD